MPTEKTAILNLKDVILNPDGTNLKDGSKEDRSPEDLKKLTPAQVLAPYPDFTVGAALIGLINTRKPENVEEMSKLSRLLGKVRTKMLTDKGQWQVEKQEILDLQEIFTKSKPETLSVNIHGQVYNKLQDLLIKVTAD